MANWSKYESHMTVQAARIVDLVSKRHGLTNVVAEIMVQPDPHAEKELFVPNVPGAHERAQVGGWAVIRENGSRDVLPARTFEADYLKVDEAPAPKPAPTAAETGDAATSGMKARVAGQPRQAPPALTPEQAAAWLHGWDDADQETRGRPGGHLADIEASARRVRLAGGPKEPPQGMDPEQMAAWNKGWDDVAHG